MSFSYQPAITKKGGEAGGGRVHWAQRRRWWGCTRPPTWTILSKPMVISTLLRASHTCGKLRGMKCSWLDTILKKSICRPQSAACSLASPSPWILWRCTLLSFNLAGKDTPPWAEVFHVGSNEGEDITTIHDREKVMEEKGQTGIQLNHLFLNIITTVKTASSYKKKCSLHLLFCVLGENFTGEAGHHVQDVIIELFREPGSINIIKGVLFKPVTH